MAAAVGSAGTLFDELFAPSPFFDAYRGFLAVQLAAETPAELVHWRGYVGSRLRKRAASQAAKAELVRYQRALGSVQAGRWRVLAHG